MTEDGTGAGLIEQIERLWRAYRRGGVAALRNLVDDDVVWLPYGAGGRALHGYEELSAYLTGRPDLIEADTYSFEEIGGGVLAAGHLRVRGGGGMTDTQLYWVYRFRDGRLVRFEAHTSRAAALAALKPENG